MEKDVEIQGVGEGKKEDLYPHSRSGKGERHGHALIGNEMWNYLPSIERAIKVPPSMMFQPWMGSDFTNDDIVKESSIINDYEHRVLGTETINGNETYKIESLPKPDARRRDMHWPLVIYARKTPLLIPRTVDELRLFLDKREWSPLRQELEAPVINATSRGLRRFPPPAGGGGFQVAGLIGRPGAATIAGPLLHRPVA